MKNFLLVVFLFLGYEISAQYNFGFTGGVNSSIIKKENLNTYKPVLRYYIGISNNYSLNENLGFELNILYSGKGYLDKEFRNNAIDRKFLRNYLDVQLLTRSHLYKKLDFIGGFGFGYLFSEVVRPNNPSIDVYSDHFDIYFIAGLQYNVSKKIKAQLKYNYTITEELKNRILQFGFIVLLKE